MTKIGRDAETHWEYTYDSMFGKETFVAKMEGTLQYKYDENGSLKSVKGAHGNGAVATL